MIRRKVILKSIVMIAIAVVLLSAAPVKADPFEDATITVIQGDTAITITQGGSLTAPDYNWWYGCSPTSAGMMMGYYDNNGYDNLVPGGTAELSNYGNPSAIANDTIASAGHIADFWGADDPVSHDLDCLADYMYTSRAKADGATSFTFWLSGNPYTEAQSLLGEGMYGVGQYLEYAGYDAATLYNQLIPYIADDLGPYPTNTIGFDFDDYMAEIDAGRPVMIQVSGHSMFGYGYGENSTVYLYDTWTPGPHTMTWGGSYSGLMHYGVMVLTPVPVPAAVLLGILGLSVVGIKLRKFA